MKHFLFYSLPTLAVLSIIPLAPCIRTGVYPSAVSEWGLCIANPMINISGTMVGARVEYFGSTFLEPYHMVIMSVLLSLAIGVFMYRKRKKMMVDQD
jgi:hypothetical protein